MFGVAKHHRLDGPEGGAATERFLVLQHERGRRAALGPSAIDARDTHSGAELAPQSFLNLGNLGLQAAPVTGAIDTAISRPGPA